MDEPPRLFNWNHTYFFMAAKIVSPSLTKKSLMHNYFPYATAANTIHTKLNVCSTVYTCDVQTLVPGCVWYKQMNSD